MSTETYKCVCGHKKTRHRPTYSEEFWFCLGLDRICMCENFKLDNLKYLEQLYEQRIKAKV